MKADKNRVASIFYLLGAFCIALAGVIEMFRKREMMYMYVIIIVVLLVLALINFIKFKIKMKKLNKEKK